MNRNDIRTHFPEASDEAIKALLDINSADITHALDKQKGEIQGLNDQISQKDASITSLTAKHEKDLSALNDKHAKDLETLNAQLKTAQDKATIADALTGKIDQLTKDLADRDATIKANAKQYLVKDELRKLHVRNVDVVMPLLDLNKIEVKDDNTLAGLTEQTKPIMDSDPYLFETNTGNQRGGFAGNQDLLNGTPQNSNDAINAAIRAAAARR